jgi:hypothetical protein
MKSTGPPGGVLLRLATKPLILDIVKSGKAVSMQFRHLTLNKGFFMNKKIVSSRGKYQKRIGPGRKSSADIDFSAIQMKDIARLFSVDVSTVCKWDCPRSPDGTYNAPEVLKWFTARLQSEPSDRTDLENQKLQLQCQKLQLEIDEAKKNTIPISEHRDFLRARAEDMKSYFLDYAAMNLHPIAMQPIETIQKHWRGLVAGCFNSYVKAIS